MKNITKLFEPEMKHKIRAQHMAEAIASVIDENGFDKAHMEVTKVRETKPSIGYRCDYRNRSTMYIRRARVSIDSTVGSLQRVKNLQTAPGRLMRVAFNELQDLVDDLRQDNTSPNLSGTINARLNIAGQAFTAAVNTTVDRTLPGLHGKPNKLPTHISQAQGRIIAERLFRCVMK